MLILHPFWNFSRVEVYRFKIKQIQPGNSLSVLGETSLIHINEHVIRQYSPQRVMEPTCDSHGFAHEESTDLTINVYTRICEPQKKAVAWNSAVVFRPLGIVKYHYPRAFQEHPTHLHTLSAGSTIH